MASIPPINPGVRMNKLKERIMNPSLSSFYSVVFPLPGFIQQQNPTLFDGELLELSCQEASLPGSSIATLEQTNDYAGVTEKMAYRRMYDETIGLTFYVDRNYKVIEMIEGWMDYISGINDTRTYEDPYVGYRMSYPKTYKNNIYLTKFEKDHFTRDFSTSGSTSTRTARTTLDYTFVQAFPIALTSIPVSYEASDVLKCSVSFNFIRYVQKRKKSVFSIQDVLGGESTRDLIVNKQPELVLN